MDGIANFFSVVPNPMVLVNTQGIMVLANERVCSLFGYEEGALTGKPVMELIPERFRETHGKYLEEYFRTPRAREMGIGMELTARHADGSEFRMERPARSTRWHRYARSSSARRRRLGSGT